MDKLFSKIGIKSLHDTGKLFYVDALAGISGELTAAVSKSADVAAFWDTVNDGSKALFRSYLQEALCCCKDFSFALASTPNASYDATLDSVDFLDIEQPVTILKDDFFDEFSVLTIPKIRFYCLSGFAGTITAHDLNVDSDLSLALATKTFTATAGRNTVEFDTPIVFRKDGQPLYLALVLDIDNAANTFKSFTQYPSESDLIVESYSKDTDVELLGETNLVLSVDAELTYDLDKIADAFFASPVMLHAAAACIGAQILDEKLGNYKLNAYLNTKREDSLERRETYTDLCKKLLKSFAPTIIAKLSKASRTPFEPTETNYSTGGYV